jgi:hypothetical protein
MRKSLWVLPLLGAAAAVVWLNPLGSAPQPADNGRGKAALPVTRVVLFSSGVGYFQREGPVQGNARVDLSFQEADINDLLKSMVLQDLGEGRISTITYGSKDPITKTLKTFAIDLTENPTLADLLSQIRGEMVEIDAPNPVSGTILGVEVRKQPQGDQVVESAWLNLLTDEGLRSMDLANVGRIKLANAQLDADLRQALNVLALGHATDKKTVSLNFLGEGARPVRVGYIQETPIWKTSYRLVLADEKAPVMQGWAIVENTTEEDWQDVDLTLVSGRPISFIMDLYQPLYVPRPVVEPELFASLRPQTYDQDLAEAEGEFAARRAAPPAPRAEAAQRPADRLERKRALAEMELADEGFDPAQGFQSVAQAGDVGELFNYVIETPVTLPRQQSAMLAIVNGEIKGEKLSIYDPSVHAKHPLNGLRLTNSTELHLMQGPVTVFDDGAYAGDAQIDDLPPGTERLVSYALDLDTEVAPEPPSQDQQLMSCKAVKGVLYTSHKQRRTRRYTVKNSGKTAKQVLIEYPIEGGWTLLAPKQPGEKTRDKYRFAVAAEPGQPASLVVEEELVQHQQVAIIDLDDGTIRFYLSQPVVSDKVKAALTEVIERKQKLSELATQRQQLEQQLAAIDQEQNRLRQNMAQLEKNNDLYLRYVKKLNEQEDQVESLRGQIQSLTAEETSLRQALDEFLASLEVE